MLKRTAIKRNQTPIKSNNKPIQKGKGLQRGKGLRAKPKSKEKILQEKEDQVKMWKLFIDCWNELPVKKCKACNTPIWGENLTIYWHHLLPKSTYPQFKYEKDNLMFLCAQCHTSTEAGYPPEKVKKATEVARKKFL